MKPIESIKQIVENLDFIAVKNKDEVIDAAEALEIFGIKVWGDGGKEDFKRKDVTIENNFLRKDDDGWRIQSHYIGNGFPTLELKILAKAYLDSKSDYQVKFEKVKEKLINVLSKDEEGWYDLFEEYRALKQKINE